MMKLLRDITHAGAPCDYLYARVRSRRAALDSKQGGMNQPGEPRASLRAEYVWVYSQVNRRHRSLLLPAFEYFESRTLVIALRYMAAKDQPALKAQLQNSLLHPQLLKLLRETELVVVAIAGLERLLEEEYSYCHGLGETYLRQGPGGLEQALVGNCLRQGIAGSRSPQVRDFLCYLLDMRNLMALYKHLRWQVQVAPPLLSGGTLELKSLEKLWAEKNQAGLLALMGKRAGLKGHPESEGVEEFMLRGLTAKLKRAGRDPLQLGLVLDYLWRCQMTTRRRGLQLAGVELTAAFPAAESSG